MINTMTDVEVQYIGAEWCKRCHILRPEVQAICAVAGAIPFNYVDFDELDENSELKATVTALPTFRIRRGTVWTTYTPNTIAAFKDALMGAAAVDTTSTDF